MRFDDIPQFPRAYYHVNVSLDYLKEHLEQWNDRKSPLILNPEWQRGHVWNVFQQIRFMEYIFRGGTTGQNIYFNCSSWQDAYNTPVYCVDGLQRITAALAFLNNEITVFEHYFKDFEDPRRIKNFHFDFHMLKIRSKKELLKIYLDFNSGGTPHNPDELRRVEKMIDETDERETI